MLLAFLYNYAPVIKNYWVDLDLSTTPVIQYEQFEFVRTIDLKNSLYIFGNKLCEFSICFCFFENIIEIGYKIYNPILFTLKFNLSYIYFEIFLFVNMLTS